MRIGVVSDIHSNLVAFEAVLDALRPFDQLWCLGDIVGYGPRPNECVGLLANEKHLAVAGNHDCAAIGTIGIEDFNTFAALAAQWTTDQLSPETRAYLEALPTLTTSGEFTLAHGSPRGPVWEYLLNATAARRASSISAGRSASLGTPTSRQSSRGRPTARFKRTESSERLRLSWAAGRLALHLESW